MCWASASPAAWCSAKSGERQHRDQEAPQKHESWYLRPRSVISSRSGKLVCSLVCSLATARLRYRWFPVSEMMRLSSLTSRNLLIALHDALATALAVFASFYLRFEGEFFAERLPLLLRILPYFVAFSVVVCYVFHLTTTKWRFISLPDALNILRAATVLTLGLVVFDYVFVAPNVHDSLGSPI